MTINLLMNKISIILILLTFFSCGKAVEEKTKELSQEEETFSDGTYVAFLIPVNGRVSNQIDGEVKISRYGDELKVTINVKNAPAGIHKQFLHTGSDCPKIAHDDNLDGMIDSFEAREVMGDRLVPFDGDLSSQNSGSIFYPSGSYHYAQSTSYHLMLSDLHLPDDILNDNMIKLLEGDLPLEEKAVAIYGKSAVGEVPIACGILTRVSYRLPRSEEGWEEPESSPRPPPVPRPDPLPHPEPEPESESWWDSIRRRWNEWWNRRET